mmetsp:Transcript_22631/g.55930  ORF Transcript_22631/g.55930 Transcript_22631/m.55930 type:complete len:251 (+) Transcript_22631:3223-3975(+)
MSSTKKKSNQERRKSRDSRSVLQTWRRNSPPRSKLSRSSRQTSRSRSKCPVNLLPHLVLQLEPRTSEAPVRNCLLLICRDCRCQACLPTTSVQKLSRSTRSTLPDLRNSLRLSATNDWKLTERSFDYEHLLVVSTSMKLKSLPWSRKRKPQAKRRPKQVEFPKKRKKRKSQQDSRQLLVESLRHLVEEHPKRRLIALLSSTLKIFFQRFDVESSRRRRRMPLSLGGRQISEAERTAKKLCSMMSIALNHK